MRKLVRFPDWVSVTQHSFFVFQMAVPVFIAATRTIERRGVILKWHHYAGLAVLSLGFVLLIMISLGFLLIAIGETLGRIRGRPGDRT